jgi:Amt family ammonium transporter
MAQIKGIVAVGAYTLIASLIFWYVIKLAIGLRVSKEEEIEGRHPLRRHAGGVRGAEP